VVQVRSDPLYIIMFFYQDLDPLTLLRLSLEAGWKNFLHM